MPRRSLLACCLLFAAMAAAGAERHVVIVTVDGLRPDAITDADTPRLARLLREGASSRDARTTDPSLTLPSHFSMVTGQSPARHGIRTNGTLSREPAGATLFTAMHDAGRRTGLYIGKHKLTALAPRDSADVLTGPGKGDANWDVGASAHLAARFAVNFPRERFALTFLHLREPDEAGHASGWMTPQYRAALAEVDRALAVVLHAIEASGLPTTVFLTADHGGEGTDHWTHGAVDWTVPWVCAGPGIAAATLADVSVIDVGPTAAAVLGVKLPDVDGKVVSACLGNAVVGAPPRRD
jgi:predicted AlkP superfamily pyrophosphatase or phosphodiesterase